MKSFYSIRLYELLKQYEKIGHRTFEIIDLKAILGIKDDEYLRYTHFKTRVLLTAQKEILKKTDIEFTFDEIKTGRVVSSIKFIIKKKEQVKYDKIGAKNDKNRVTSKAEQKSFTTANINLNELRNLLNLLPEKEKEKKSITNIISNYLTKHDLSYIERNIKYSNKHSKTNYRVFLEKSLINDWGLVLQEDQEIKEKLAQSEKEKRKLELEKENIEQQISDYINVNYDSLKEKAIKRLENDLSINEFESESLKKIGLHVMIKEIAKENISKNV